MTEDDDARSATDEAVLTDKFYRGTIVKLFQGAQVGVIRSASGREVSFAFVHVVMVGTLRRFDDLREGMTVGFDVGWTSNGLRVTVIRADG
jgi:hypothetical protein